MILGTKTKKVWNAGIVCNLKVYDSKKAVGLKFATFDLQSQDCGFINCKTFDSTIAQMLQNGQFIIIKDMYIKKSSYINQQAIKVWKQDIICSVIQICDYGVQEVKKQEEAEIEWDSNENK